VFIGNAGTILSIYNTYTILSRVGVILEESHPVDRQNNAILTLGEYCLHGRHPEELNFPNFLFLFFVQA
jgi:hypothetical protein